MTIYYVNREKMIGMDHKTGLYSPVKYWGNIVIIKKTICGERKIQFIAPDGKRSHSINKATLEYFKSQFKKVIERYDRSTYCPRCGEILENKEYSYE